MEIADCTLLLNNDRANTVVKIDVTPAEVMVLRAIHGLGAVQDIQIKSLTSKGKDASKRAHHRELSRLRNKYTAAPGATPDGFNGGMAGDPKAASVGVVYRLFPGASPVLPIKFQDIEIPEHDDESGTEEVEVNDDNVDAPAADAAGKQKRGRRKIVKGNHPNPPPEVEEEAPTDDEEETEEEEE